jgi:ubiquinone/menaquinone biosynthesis C-methylase UbiE
MFTIKDQSPKNRPWEVWEGNSGYLDLMIARAKGLEPEMKCAEQMSEILIAQSIFPARVLDVCCSCGHYYHTLRRRNPEVEYVGVDISPAYVSAGQHIFSGNPRIRIAQGDLFRLDFPDNSFDLVLCYNTIQNLPHFEKPFQELLRVSSRHVLLRMLCSQERRPFREMKRGAEGGEALNRYEYHNTWSFQDLQGYVKELGPYALKFIPDKIVPLPEGPGTQVVNGSQFLKGILYEWWHLLISKPEVR